MASNGLFNDNASCERSLTLHSQPSESRRKTYVLVKLTDSALQSIDDYLASRQSARLPPPTIQFESKCNQGVISLPSNGNNAARYAFNLSQVDVDGPQGSFECLRESPADAEMHSLGAMLYKLQIQAGEDIYAKTRVKMAVAEQDAKKHSTKVIKETGPNVGRKVKLKKTLLPSGSDRLALNGSSSASTNVSALRANAASLGQTSSAIQNLNGSALVGLSSSSLNSVNMNSSSVSNGIGSTNGLTNSAPPAKPPVLPVNAELMRKPFRERVIHLLALRPYKKPELLARLNREGIREKDKKGLGLLLNSIATLKDNTYHLHRGAWHEVQPDEWQFYSNEDRELVKKRNPLNSNNNNNNSSATTSNGSTATIGALNGNGLSSTASSANLITGNNIGCNGTTSSSSLTSSSNAANSSNSNNKFDSNLISPLSSDSMQAFPSPPSLIACNSPLNKRSVDSIAYPSIGKKQRISHATSSSQQMLSSSTSASSATTSTTTTTGQRVRTSPSQMNGNSNSGTQSKPLNSNAYNELMNGWASKPKSPPEIVNNNSNGSSTGNHSSTANTSSNSDRLSFGRTGDVHNASTASALSTAPTPLDSSRSSSNASHFGYFSNSTLNGPLTNGISNSNGRSYSPAGALTNGLHHSNSSNNNNTSSSNLNNSSHHHASHNHHHNNHSNSHHHHSHALAQRASNSGGNGSLCSTPNSSPDSGTGSQDGCLSTASSRSSSSGMDSQSLDYVHKYAPISNNEQRARYKSDFNSEYEEYKQLHHFLDKNSIKFAQLEQKLRKATEGSDLWNVSSISCSSLYCFAKKKCHFSTFHFIFCVLFALIATYFHFSIRILSQSARISNFIFNHLPSLGSFLVIELLTKRTRTSSRRRRLVLTQSFQSKNDQQVLVVLKQN